jgi:LacI family repressor for deo operon, udp, cdd, tsx, nupC, and nupG
VTGRSCDGPRGATRVIDYMSFDPGPGFCQTQASAGETGKALDDAGRAEAGGSTRVARIQDVARLAEVSTATEARARVMEAIAKVGYVPNPVARSLRSQKTRMILVVVPNLENTFFSRILRGIEETLFEAGYSMIIGDLDGSSEKEARFAAYAAAGQVDGVLLLNGHLFGHRRDRSGRALHSTVPLVALCEAIPGADIPQIEVDNRDAARRMTEYLTSLGHRRVAYVRGPRENVLEGERFEGYRAGLMSAGLSVDPDLVWPGDYTLDAGTRAGHRFVARADRPTAVFCSNDEMAIGFTRTLSSAGIRVPDEVSVAGFDDIEFAAAMEPPLTTIRQPRRELGQAGATVLLDLLASRHAPKRVRLKTDLVIRGSTARPP